MNSSINLLLDTAKRFGGNVALEDFNGSVTYSELVEKGFSVGTAILDAIGESSEIRPVLVYLPKSIDAVISFMGVLCTANPYVPINDNIPPQRLSAIIESLHPAMIITDSDGMDTLQGLNLCGAKAALYCDLAKTEADDKRIYKSVSTAVDLDPAYIMYTSGSTGIPKGVTISHRGIIDYAEWLTSEFEIDERSVLGLQSGFHFDNSVFDIYGSFLKGAKLVIIHDTLFMYPDKLIEHLREKEVTCIFWVPTVMISSANSGAIDKIPLPKLKTVVFAGEVMPNKQLNAWRRAYPHCTYANLYGPTEITVDCIYYIVDREFEDSDPLPIGRACPNMRILLLDENGKQVTSPGERGEICVGGSGVGLGYWNDPKASQGVFVQNPCNTLYNEIIYKTGDIGYYSEDNLIMFAGRKDSQIKYRGNRIELGDIETAIVAVGGIGNACAVFDEEKQEIIAIIETAEDITLRRLCAELKKTLPGYMLPKRLIVTEKLPCTPNGKIDRVKIKKQYLPK